MSGQSVRLALLAAAPMYYQAPLYRRLAADPRLDFTALFASRGGVGAHDAGYGRPVEWGVDPLKGYRSVFLKHADTAPIHGGFFALRDASIARHLVGRGVDVLWLHGYKFATHQAALAIQRLRGRPVLWREEQTLLHPRPRAHEVVRSQVLRWMTAQTSGLYIGTRNLEWLRHYGMPDTRLSFTPYCVDNDALQADQARLAPLRKRLRARFGVNDDRPLLVTVSRLIPKKNVELLIDAFTELRQTELAALVIVGAGPAEQELRRRATDVEGIHFAGFLDQLGVPEAYAAADAFVLVSKRDETWGLVVNEAMNFSLPVIVSDAVGCAADLVNGHGSGLVVGSEDRGSLVDAMRRLCIDEDLRRSMGQAAQRRISGWNHDVAAEGVIVAVSRAVGPARWALAEDSRRPKHR